MADRVRVYEELLANKVFTGYGREFSSSWLSSPTDFQWVEKDLVIEENVAFYTGPYFLTPRTALASICSIGSYSYSHSPLHPGMTVGRYSSIASGLRILDFAHPTSGPSSSIAFFRPPKNYNLSPLNEEIIAQSGDLPIFDPTLGKSYPIIGSDVWIGQNVTLALGIEIGNGSVIAANSTVTQDVEPYTIVAGSPAKQIRKRFPENLISALLESNWWDYKLDGIRGIYSSDIEEFLKKFETSRIPLAEPSFLTLRGSSLEKT